MHTDKKRTGRSPLLLHCSSLWSSLTFVRKANLPTLVQASHVPSATASLPPKMARLSSHHCKGYVPLQNPNPHSFRTNQNHIKIRSRKQARNWGVKPNPDRVSPVAILVPVQQQEQGVAWMRLPHERRYAHFGSLLFAHLVSFTVLCSSLPFLNSHTLSLSLTTSYFSSVGGWVPEFARRFIRVCCVFLGWWRLCPYGMDSVKCSMWFGLCPSLVTSFQCFLTKHLKAWILPELMTQQRMYYVDCSYY